jgi:hypothetical protein
MIYTPIGANLIKAEAEQKRWSSYAIAEFVCLWEGRECSPFACFTKVTPLSRKSERIYGKRGDHRFQCRKRLQERQLMRRMRVG